MANMQEDNFTSDVEEALNVAATGGFRPRVEGALRVLAAEVKRLREVLIEHDQARGEHIQERDNIISQKDKEIYYLNDTLGHLAWKAQYNRAEASESQLKTLQSEKDRLIDFNADFEDKLEAAQKRIEEEQMKRADWNVVIEDLKAENQRLRERGEAADNLLKAAQQWRGPFPDIKGLLDACERYEKAREVK